MRHTDGPACVDDIDSEAVSFVSCTASSTGSSCDAVEVTLDGVSGVKCDARVGIRVCCALRGVRPRDRENKLCRSKVT